MKRPISKKSHASFLLSISREFKGLDLKINERPFKMLPFKQ